MSELVQEIRAQAERFAQSHRLSDAPSRIIRVDHPHMPEHWTFIIEQEGEPLVIIDLDAAGVLEAVDEITARPGLIFEGIRRTARTLYIDRHLVGFLRAALARTA